MEITNRMMLELGSHEALVRTAYKDIKGIWTWSVGITSMSGHKVERYIGNEQSYEHCMAIYRWALQKYAREVREAFAGYDLTEAQFAAALSFHYNTGAIKTASWVKQFKAGKLGAAKRSIMNWKKPAEIVPRRKKERDLFFDGKWSNNGTMIEYQVSRSGNIIWSSAKEVPADILFKELKQTEIPAPKPKPAIVDTVTAPIGKGFFATLFDLLGMLFGKRK